jgi:hypothetical protein
MAIEIYGTAMRSLGEWVTELESDDHHSRADVLAATSVLWVCSLDEALRERHAPYAEALNRHEIAEVLRGLRFARNAIVHGFVVCARSRGLEYPITFPIDWGPWVWNTADHYLASWTPRGKRSAQDGLAAYREHIERQRLEEPLRKAVDWLEEWRSVAAM